MTRLFASVAVCLCLGASSAYACSALDVAKKSVAAQSALQDLAASNAPRARLIEGEMRQVVREHIVSGRPEGLCLVYDEMLTHYAS